MGHSAQHVLLIEDNPADAELFAYAMQENSPVPFDITHIERVERLKELSGAAFDVAMLDMHLPGISDMDAIRFIQEQQSTLPIIVLTGINDEEKALEAMRMGVQDYLVKGTDAGEIIRRAIRYSIERKRFSDKISYLMHYDQQTGLINGGQFRTLTEKAIARAKKQEGMLGVLLIDIDNFKHINDAFGPAAGDKLLIEVAQRLKLRFGDLHTIAHASEDAFLLLMEDIAGMENCADTAENVMAIFQQPFDLQGKEFSASAGVGIAVYPTCGKEVDTLISHAEDALRKAKSEGRKRYCFFTDKLNEDVQERVMITSGLFHALAKEEFSLYYQPQIDLKSERLVGLEALIRWRHPTMNQVSPALFIPLAEKAGLIGDITRWVLQTACCHHKEIQSPKIKIGVNISARELHQPQLIQTIADILRETRMDPQCLALELTETAVMEDTEKALAALRALKELGVRLHIDDFGTGYSSLSYLKLLPVDALKIDLSFVQGMVANAEDKKIVKVIIDLAHDFGLGVIAEGIETETHANYLRLMQCETGQGYLYAKPMPLAELNEWLTSSGMQRATCAGSTLLRGRH